MFMAGIKADRVRTSAEGPEVAVGTLGYEQTSAGPKGYVYIRDSGSAITGTGYVVLIDGSDYTAVMATTTTAAPGTGSQKMVGVAVSAIAASGYGWAQIYGPCTIRTLASAVAYTTLNTTATAGALDDDASVGARVIEGLSLDVATGGAPAATAGFLNWPKVSRTL